MNAHNQCKRYRPAHMVYYNLCNVALSAPPEQEAAGVAAVPLALPGQVGDTSGLKGHRLASLAEATAVAIVA